MNMENFQNPPKEYREVPFWSWNDRLERDELVWQIEEMDKQGWGGFFMHSRKGLVTPYLSEEWLSRIQECVEEAKRRGMGAWLYDEDKWPSGFCGGKIPKLGSEYRQKALLMREDDLELPRDEVRLLKAYAARKQGPKSYADITCIDADAAEQWKKEGYTILYFYKWTQPIGPNRFNNTAWVDLLNPKVTDAFLESTHEIYKRRIGSEFGKTVPGIFTDESTVLYWAYAPKIALPWSEHFESYFMEYNGYDITEKLPYLFINLEGFEKIRYDYWKVVTGCFVENYVKRIYEWCEQNNLKYTGHFMAEDYFEFTMQYIGSLMPAYEYMHIPGVDHLNRNINDVMTVKQVTSVAHQLGKERVLCEMFGCSGQNFSFEHRKWIADWNLIHGINFINPHLSLYSMRGERKRDYPPNLFYQQPWWEHNKKIADYCSRLSYVLSMGKRVTDILVIHSIESAWCCYNPTDVVLAEEGQFDTPDTWIEYKPSPEFKVNELSYGFDEVLNILLRLHYDYDLGDEAIIARHGRAEGRFFRVGQGEYGIVMVPPSITLRKSTALMLQDFVNSGGVLAFIGEMPRLIDGAPDPSGILEAIAGRACVLPLEASAIKEFLEKCGESRVSVEGEGNEAVWYHLRKVDNKTVAFFANTDKDREITVSIDIRAKGHVEQWDPFKGCAIAIPFEHDGRMTRIAYTFPPAGSLLIVIDEEREAKPFRTPYRSVIGCYELDSLWEIEPLNKNSITLDYCTCSLNDSDAGGLMPVHRVHDAVMKNKKDFVLSYFFDSADWDGNGGMLVVESPECFNITLNGVPVNRRFGGGYWVDKSFKTAVISDLVKAGTNIVELRAKWHENIEIESIYILGDFEVENQSNRSFKLVKPKKEAVSGDLVYKGYPFFTGKMRFCQKWSLAEKGEEQYFLEVEQQGSIVVEAAVNGHMAEAAIVRPYVWDITPYITEGENLIEITLTTSLHNLLGPHHSTKGEITACAPASFRDEKNWTDEYHFVELGVRRARIYKVVQGTESDK